MGLVLMPSEIKTNMKMLQSYLESETERYQNVREKVYEYSVNEELTTESYQKSKELMDVCYQLIADGMNAVGESIRGDIDTIRGRIGDEYLNEDLLIMQIERLRAQCEQYEAKIRSLESKKFLLVAVGVTGFHGIIAHYKEMIENLKEQIAVLQKKLEFLENVEESTANLFQSAIGLLAALQNVIADGGVNVDAYNVLYEKLGLPVITEEVKRLIEMEKFRKDLIEQGFPEGYMHYLMILHEKYPEWKFQAVITEIDYRDFLEAQFIGKVKCAEKEKYCDKNIFSTEKSGKYYEANREAVRFFSNPYSLLQTESEAGYENAIQFLKVDQKLPQEYIDMMVPKILLIDEALASEKEERIIEAIKTVDCGVNPVALAAIYAAESGPKGEDYNGKAVYNVFNIGGTTGREAARRYAYDHEWFSLEACLEGSKSTLEEYINVGQDTLYAMDWNYVQYETDKPIVHQYSTLVNDAEDKALNICKRKGKKLDLHQEFIFKIPVYENVLTYGDEKYGAFPDPNKQ